eukprot:s2399_g7.t1
MLVLAERYETSTTSSQLYIVGWTAQQVRYNSDSAFFLGSSRTSSLTAEREGLTWAFLWRLGINCRTPTIFRSDSLLSCQQSTGSIGTAEVDDTFLCLRGAYQLLATALPTGHVAVEHIHGHTNEPSNDFTDFAAKRESLSSFYLPRFKLDMAMWRKQLPHLWLIYGAHLGCPRFLGDGFDISAPSLPELDMPLSEKEPPSPTEDLDMANITVSFCTANVLSMYTALDGFPGKLGYLVEQFQAHALLFGGIQEARTPQGSCRCQQVQRFCTGAHRGSGGVELWLNLQQPYGFVGKKPLYLKPQQIQILEATPRILLARLTAPYLDIVLLVAHAPHSGKPEQERQAWWTALTTTLHRHCGALPLYVMMDANAAPGDGDGHSVLTTGLTSSRSTPLRRSFLEEFDLTLPQTAALRFDRSAIRTASHAHFLQDFPPMEWSVDVETQTQEINQHVLRHLHQQCPPRRGGPKKSFITEAIWQLRRDKLKSRRSLRASRRSRAAELLRTVFRAWRQDPSDFVDLAYNYGTTLLCGTVRCLAEFRAFSKTLKRALKTAKHQCVADSLQTLPPEASSTSILHVLRPLLGSSNLKNKGLAPLPQIRNEAGQICASPAAALDRWIEFFCTMEGGSREPLEHKGGRLVPIWKRKLDKTQCAAYRSILISSHVGKCIHRTLRLHQATVYEQYLLRQQIGGKRRAPVTLGVHAARAFLRCQKERNKPTALVFLDLSEAFYRVIRPLALQGACTDEALFTIATRLGLDANILEDLRQHLQQPAATLRAALPAHLRKALQALHEDTHWHIGTQTDQCRTTVGTRPGDAFADVVFGYLWARVLRDFQTAAGHHSTFEVFPTQNGPAVFGRSVDTEQDATTFVGPCWMDDLCVALSDHHCSDLIRKTTTTTGLLLDHCLAHAMTPNLAPGKTEILFSMRGRGARAHKVALYGPVSGRILPIVGEYHQHEVHVVTQYNHLGCTLHHTGDLRAEIRRRISIAHAAFQEHRKVLFRNQSISLSKKTELFQCLILSKFQYGTESWIMEDRATCEYLHAALIRLYRRLLGARGDVDLTDDQVLYETGLPSPTEGATHLPDPEANPEAWLAIARDHSSYWKRLIRRGGLHARRQRAREYRLVVFHRDLLRFARSQVFQVPAPASSPAVPEDQQVFGCMSCGLRFKTRGGEGAHMYKVHGMTHPVRSLFQTTQCLGCMKDYHTAAKLKAHPIRSDRCRRYLLGTGHRYAPMPGSGSRVDAQLSHRHDRLLPPLRLHGPLPAGVGDRDFDMIHWELLAELCDRVLDMQEVADLPALLHQLLAEHVVAWTRLGHRETGPASTATSLSQPSESWVLAFSEHICPYILEQQCCECRVPPDWNPPRAFGRHRVILHAFSGRRRVGDFQFYFDLIAKENDHGFIIHTVSLDIVVDAKNGNLADETVRAFWHHGISSACIIAFSRGLRVKLGIFAHFLHGWLAVIEHPKEPEKAELPSIWRLPLFALLRALPGAELRTLSQGLLGAPSMKPTSLLTLNLPGLPRSIVQHRLVPNNPQGGSIGRTVDGHWKTCYLKEYPPAMNKVLAEQFWTSIASLPVDDTVVSEDSFLSVFMAENSETKEIVAIKAASKKEDPIFGGFPVSLLREINILRSVRHENIVQLHEIAQTPQGDPLIVMEFCQASLLELIHSPKHDLSFSEIKYIIRQVLDATGCLHQRGILHRDLATKNVLFNLSGEIKVCDFGISRMAFGQDDDLGFISAKGLEPPNMIVSLPYRAIELLLGETKYGPKLDIWSVGCILAEILLCQTGRRIPFFGGSLENPNKNPTMYVEEIFQIMGKPTVETWPNLHKLPLLKTYNTGKISSAKSHKEQGDERAFLRRFFRSQEGKPADTKYCLTESFFELLAGLLTLCPNQRMTAAEALEHPFFTKEKPVPEWHAWHWALASAEIPRGDKKAKVDEDETKKLLKQLSKEELGQGDEEKGQHGHKAVLEKWREQAEKRQQEELKRSSSTKAAPRIPSSTSPISALHRSHVTASPALNCCRPAMACPICFEVPEPSQIMSYATMSNHSWQNSTRCNGHGICRACMGRYVEIQILEEGHFNPRCPGERCSYRLVPLDVERALEGSARSLEARQRFEQLRSECHAGRLKELLSEQGKTPASTAWLLSECQPCPRCLTLVRREEGCLHVFCRCGCDFCFGCGGPDPEGCICHYMEKSREVVFAAWLRTSPESPVDWLWDSRAQREEEEVAEEDGNVMGNPFRALERHQMEVS